MSQQIAKIMWLAVCAQLFSGCASDVTGFYLVEKHPNGKSNPIDHSSYVAICSEVESVMRSRGFEVFRESEGDNAGRVIRESFDAAIGPKGEKPMNIYGAVSSPTRLSITWKETETTVVAKGIDAVADGDGVLVRELKDAISRASGGKEVALVPRRILIRN